MEAGLSFCANRAAGRAVSHTRNTRDLRWKQHKKILELASSMVKLIMHGDICTLRGRFSLVQGD